MLFAVIKERVEDIQNELKKSAEIGPNAAQKRPKKLPKRPQERLRGPSWGGFEANYEKEGRGANGVVPREAPKASLGALLDPSWAAPGRKKKSRGASLGPILAQLGAQKGVRDAEKSIPTQKLRKAKIIDFTPCFG